MARFKVRWVDGEGVIHENREEGESAAAVEARMRARGKRPLEIRRFRWSVTRVGRKLSLWRKSLASGKLSHRRVHEFFYELGVVLTSGVPLLAAIHLLRREPLGGSMGTLLEHLEKGIKGGETLSALLEREKGYDFRSMAPILRMGERTGKLGESCRTVAGNLDEWIRIQSDLTSALIYPSILVVTGILAVYLLMVAVIPRFQQAISGFKVVLPGHARWLFGASSFLSAHHDLIMLFLILFCGLLLLGLRLRGTREKLTALAGRLPGVRNVRFAAENLRFVSALSHLLAGKIPILPALELAGDMFTAPEIKRHIADAVTDLKRGRRLADALENTGAFPAMQINMIRVGEESGSLEQVTAELSQLMSRRFSRRLRTAMAFLEPLVILLIAGFVALLVLSILPVIMDLGELGV